MASGGGYSSPQFAVIRGVPQILQSSASHLTSIVPTNGRVLWEHAWKGTPIVQPALLADGGILFWASGPTGGLGTKRLSAAPDADGWKIEERWTSVGLKPYFSDVVLQQGHAFGLDGGILACLELEAGRPTWKDGRYGHGQLLLLADQSLLLILSEQGELALVRATPERFEELARVPAITGKTWNHPVVVADLVLVRNGDEMAAFRLPAAPK